MGVPKESLLCDNPLVWLLQDSMMLTDAEFPTEFSVCGGHGSLRNHSHLRHQSNNSHCVKRLFHFPGIIPNTSVFLGMSPQQTSECSIWGQPLPKWARSQPLGKRVFYFQGALGSNFVAQWSTMPKMLNDGLFDLQVANKSLSQCTERMIGWYISHELNENGS